MPLAARPLYRWQLRTRALELGERTRLMAIINLTPDSFSGDGLSPRGLDASLAAAISAADEGADIIDLGAESTRPGSTPITATQEQARLLPVLEALLQERPTVLVSVDTYHAATARAAALAGAEIINDVSGLAWDSSMAATVAATACGLVMMHTRGRPTEWRTQPRLAAAEILPLVFAGLCESLASAEAAGVASERIVADPGFGFGKVDGENLVLLAGLSRLHELGRPLLVGLSRKSFLGNIVRPVQSGPLPPIEARRTATTAANVAAILAGAHVLRVHDLQPAREAAALADALLEAHTPVLQPAAFDA
ncbi:MAG TPA: dihydropteroate synthase [Acidobacteriaceae bacterium]|nr:dihydropteroate synthase [Acidobacteriaceae bacterium]